MRAETRSPQETERVGAEVAATLVAGDVVLILGEMGAGKTTFVRGAAREIGVITPVTSPTFSIGQRYAVEGGGPVRAVSHIDLYRVGSLAGEDPDLLADYIGSDTISFVEWPDGAEREIAELAHIARRVRLTHAGGDVRTVEVW